jgi:hypothetical protein
MKKNKYDKYLNVHNQFRHLCNSKINVIRKWNLPFIIQDQKYEAVLIEYRQLPHIEFLIRNTIHKLGDEWSHTIVCGNLNYSMVCSICKNISNNIKIIKTDFNNLTQNEYNNYLLTTDFWNLLTGEKILIYQEDTCIFKQNINDFIHYDYIGAPFLKTNNDTPSQVGNGGLSIRTRQCMIDIINNFPKENTIIQSSTIPYMKYNKLDNIPEDVYFSINIHNYDKYIIADFDVAYDFSTEIIYNSTSFGGHKFWLNDINWNQRIEQLLHENVYDNINTYKIDNINTYKIDSLICNDKSKIGMTIVNTTQIFNLFKDNIKIDKKILVKHNDEKYIDLTDFIKKLEGFTFDEFYNLTMKKIADKIKSNNLLVVVFIGNETIGMDLINIIIKYKEIQDFSVSFCIKYTIIDNFIEIIDDNFDNYAIYSSNEFGNDITPSMLMYNDIIKNYKYDYIIKLHTKTNHLYYKSTSILLKYNLTELINKKEHEINSNCFGYKYVEIQDDVYNKLLYEKYNNIINKNKFVEGTIFFTDAVCFNQANHFLKENYYIFFISNMYDNNNINKHNSYVHFLERLFGIIYLSPFEINKLQ